ncbi:hypothetical protein CGRA01v4_03285 [Colletotrichum graminicola]|nr:hypothetical protein CGRA01v4_03285 [Colletotrichum graminicola]
MVVRPFRRRLTSPKLQSRTKCFPVARSMPRT